MDKPKFDPSKPFEAVEDSKPKFDPSQPFEADSEPSLILGLDATDEEVANFQAKRDEFLNKAPSTMSDFGSGAAQGATFGLADELKGMGKGSILGGIKDAGKFVGLPPEATDADVKDYRDARDISRQAYKDAEERSPAAYLTGMLGGGLASSLATGGAAVAATGANLGRAGLATLAAGEGAALGAGTSEAETPKEFAQDVGTSAALSAGGSVILPKIASTLGTSGTLGALAGGLGTYALNEDATLPKIATGAGAGYLAGKGLGKLGSSTLESLPIVQKFSRGKAAGEEGVNLLKKETREGILQGERKATADQARAIANREKQVNEAVDAANKKFNDIQKKTLDLTKSEQTQLQGAKRQELALKIRKEAEDLSKKVDGIRKQSGEAIEGVYEDLQKTPVKIATTGPLEELSGSINAITQNIPEADPTRLGLQKVITRINEFSGDLSAKEFKQLQKVVKDYAYDGTVSDPNIQRLFKGAYFKLNQQAVKDMAAQGAQDLADTLTTSNNTYSKIFTIEDQLGRYGTYKAPEKATDTLINLSKTQAGGENIKASAKLGAKYQKFFDALKEVDPESYKKITGEVMDLSKQYADAGKAVDANLIKKITEEKLEQLAKTDLNLANMPKILEEQIPATEMRKLVGKQLPIESTGGIQPSGDLFKMFRKDAPSDLVTKQEEYKKLLPKLLGEEQSSKLIKQGEKASERSDLISSFDEGNSYSPRLATQAMSYASGISVGLGNILGLAERKVTGANLASILDRATPDKLKQAGAFIMNKVGGEGSSKQFSDLLTKAAESTDPIKRRAILFTLQQNPEFRTMFNNENNQNE